MVCWYMITGSFGECQSLTAGIRPGTQERALEAECLGKDLECFLGTKQ